jgi:CheY-like chemotaxis protein
MERVCIVDDYDINLFVLNEYLNETYEVIQFTDSKKCIEYLRTNKIKIVLMDCFMPALDGYEATKIIKKELNNVKVIGVTANPFQDNIEKCKLSGMDDVIVKPIIKTVLMEIIKKHLNE